MKKLMSLLGLCCFLFLVSCQKEVSDSISAGDYYIKGKIDGQPFQYTKYALAIKDALPVVTSSLTLSAMNNTPGDTSGNFSMQIIGISSKIVPGTYTADSEDFSVVGAWLKNPADSAVYANDSSRDTANPFQIVISSIDGGIVSGSFKGTFYYTGFGADNMGTDTTKTKVFSDGAFRLKIQ